MAESDKLQSKNKFIQGIKGRIKAITCDDKEENSDDDFDEIAA